MSKRVCDHCLKVMPPETEHYIINDYKYCTDCVEATPYTAYIYSIEGEYVGSSDDEDVQHIEEYEDEYEEEE